LKDKYFNTSFLPRRLEWMMRVTWKFVNYRTTSENNIHTPIH